MDQLVVVDQVNHHNQMALYDFGVAEQDHRYNLNHFGIVDQGTITHCMMC